MSIHIVLCIGKFSNAREKGVGYYLTLVFLTESYRIFKTFEGVIDGGLVRLPQANNIR